MRKYIYIILALLLLGVANVASATNIPALVDPKNYPTVWTELVYNGSGSTIASGYIVDWDFDTSDSDASSKYDDMCPWVKTNATDEGVWQAGVVPYGKNIANGDVGAIVIKGPVYVVVGTALTADELVAANGSGQASPFDGGANNECSLGVAIKVSSLQGAPNGEAAGVNGWGLIYVDPARYDEN